MTKGKVLLLVLAAAAGLFAVAYTQLTVFIVPPIGAVPEGRTLVISRMNKTEFIDSPDAMCERIQGGVSLLCRGVALGAIATNAKIYARLPYSETLAKIANEGRTYER